MKYEIKNRWDGNIIYQDEAESFRALILAAVAAKTDLSSADLRYADLSSADLRYADLRYADLSSADLSSANLSSANLRYADLSSADLRYADLRYADLRYANLSSANLYGYFSFGPGGSRNSYTWSRWEESGYMVHCGCQVLTLKNFEAQVNKTHKNTYFAKWYQANIKTMKMIAKASEVDFKNAQAVKEPAPSKEKL